MRLAERIDTDGVRDQTREMYDDASWRLLEERIDDDGGAWDRAGQQLRGARYIDDRVFRRDGTG